MFDRSTFLKKTFYAIILLVLYATAASQALQSFSYKWTTIAVDDRYSLNHVFSGEAPRPFAFRVLVPVVLNETYDAIPKNLSGLLLERSRRVLDAVVGAQESALLDDSIAIKYGFLTVLNFLLLLLTMLLLRELAKRVVCPGSGSRFLVDASPLFFALLLTISYRAHNGFHYDHAELFLYCSYLILIMGRHWWAALSVLVLSVLNKETAMLFPLIAFFAFHKDALWRREGTVWKNVILQSGVAIVVHMGVRSLISVGGPSAELHFLDNISFWFSWEPWFSVTTPHMALLPLPKPSNILLFVPLMALVVSGWAKKPLCVRNGLIVSVMLSLPLFIVFCYRDEFRNLSLAFPFVFLAATDTLMNFYKTKEA